LRELLGNHGKKDAFEVDMNGIAGDWTPWQCCGCKKLLITTMSDGIEMDNLQKDLRKVQG